MREHVFMNKKKSKKKKRKKKKEKRKKREKTRKNRKKTFAGCRSDDRINPCRDDGVRDERASKIKDV